MYDTYLYNKNTKSLKVSMYVYSMRSIKKLIIIKRIISLQLKKEKENKRLEKGRGC